MKHPMKNNSLDNIFKEKINQAEGLPENIKWNKYKGWLDYKQKHVSANIFSKRALLYASSAAAAILILFSVLYYQSAVNKTITVYNQSAIVKEIMLPDGNKIWLNKNSFIEYPSKLDKDLKVINVGGEIYVELKKMENANYIIYAHNAYILAEKNASFNIRAYGHEDNIDVTVASGAIKIADQSYEKGLSLIVTEGNYCSVHKSQKLVYAATNTNNNFAAWKTKKLIFDNQPIATVRDILAEYYNTDIELEDKDIAYCLFSGSFEKQSLDYILDKIRSDLHFKIENTGTKITFSGKGCL